MVFYSFIAHVYFGGIMVCSYYGVMIYTLFMLMTYAISLSSKCWFKLVNRMHSTKICFFEIFFKYFVHDYHT